METPRRESLKEHLERIYQLEDPRPCLHFYEINAEGVLACVRCSQPHPADPSRAD